MSSDPDPEAPGIYISTSVTWQQCTNGSQSDSDADGLSNLCENNLASSFAPELRYDPVDDVGREPHWAARREGNRVRIAYLLSYYRDHGSTGFLCSLPGAGPACGGHNGDSEEVVLDVYYDPESVHWVLDRAWYSAHGNYNVAERGDYSYPVTLQYPSGVGDYPRVWVSKGKHANYNNQQTCNSGGFLNIDTCFDNTAQVRLFVSAATNIGSRATHTSSTQDCMVSANPSFIYYGSGRQECYWTDAPFRGWIPTSVGGAQSSSYSPHLAYFGF